MTPRVTLPAATLPQGVGTMEAHVEKVTMTLRSGPRASLQLLLKAIMQL